MIITLEIPDDLAGRTGLGRGRRSGRGEGLLDLGLTHFSAQNPLQNIPMHIRQPVVPALEFISQL